MNALRQLGSSLLLAVLSATLVIGGISLALAESYVPVIPPTPTATQVLFPTFSSPTTVPSASISIPSTQTPLPASTNTVPPPPTSCPPPAGWVAVPVGPGDDLTTLAFRYHSTPQQLSVANCLFSNNLPFGSYLYVPPVPTQTSVPCGPPPGWVRYIVQSGNTLFSLSQAYGVSLSQLQFANCMAANQYYLYAGQTLWVPNVVTRTPRATSTPTLTPIVIIFPTITGTATATGTATNLPTATAPPTSTSLPTATPTGTATGTATATATATAPPPTAPPTASATITAFPTQTSNP